jgi:hypothetical protein
MKVRTIGPLLFCVLLVSCSPQPKPQFAYDHAATFANLKTFDWYADPDEDKTTGGGAIVDARWVDEHIKGAVTAELEKKGFRAGAGESAQFFVEYHTRAAGITQRDKYGAYSWWAPYQYVGSQTYRQATLAVDIRDASKKLIWRAWITRTLGTSPEQLDAQIRKYAAELLSHFPPSEAAKS